MQPGWYARVLLTGLLASQCQSAMAIAGTYEIQVTSFASDAGTASELEQITKLQMSRSPVLNEAAREEAQTAIAAYNANTQNLNRLLSRTAVDSDSKAIAVFDNLIKAVSPCQWTAVKSSEDELAGIYNYLAESHAFLQRVLTPETPFGIYGGDESLLTIRLEPAQFCEKNNSAEKVRALQVKFLATLKDAKAALQSDQDDAQRMIPRLQKLADSWTTRKKALERAIEDASPAGKVADQLWQIMAVFCTFAIAIFATTKLFSTPIQLELVASGQIIQFATVMVILIVVCVLGISRILQENTLGTLLGAIGGYVLSQGIGRAATRAASQAAEDKPAVDKKEPPAA